MSLDSTHKEQSMLTLLSNSSWVFVDGFVFVLHRRWHYGPVCTLWDRSNGPPQARCYGNVITLRVYWDGHSCWCGACHSTGKCGKSSSASNTHRPAIL